MAKKSAIEKNKNRRRLVELNATKRQQLKDIICDRKLSAEERFQAQLKVTELPRNSSKTRIRNRCELSGRPRGFYRKFRLSRIALRDMASEGQIPGMTKASW